MTLWQGGICKFDERDFVVDFDLLFRLGYSIYSAANLVSKCVCPYVLVVSCKECIHCFGSACDWVEEFAHGIWVMLCRIGMN